MDKELEMILHYFPSRVGRAVEGFLAKIRDGTHLISEIRVRAGAPISVTYSGRNVVSFGGEMLICTETEIRETMQKLCEDSVHTFDETLREGYIVLENGYRVGVAGRAGVAENEIRHLYAPTSLVVRIPHPVIGVSLPLMRHLIEYGRVQSALFYAVPNVGKTTLIRDLARSLSTGLRARRVSIIDTRGELAMKSMFSESIADFLYGYPRAKGIEIATRTLSPEVIFCDEIGAADEAAAILSAQNSGVPLIATAHANSLEALLLRPNIRMLYENRVFRYYIGLAREGGAEAFQFDIFDSRGSEVAFS